jgi:hypothetical protein
MFDPTNGAQRCVATEEITYDSKGFRIEELRLDGSGDLEWRRVYTRDGWRVLKQVFTSKDVGQNNTVVNRFTSDGLIESVEIYDGSGSLVQNTTSNYKTTGNETIALQTETDSSGLTHATRTVETHDPNAGITTQQVFRDGELRSSWVIKRNTAGEVVSDALSFADGQITDRVTDENGSVREHDFWPPSKTHSYQTTDKNNRVTEYTVDSPAEYIRHTYKYDAQGNEIEAAAYNRKGELVRKITTEYLFNDVQQNWTEKRKFLWEKTAKIRTPTLVEHARRTIFYY